MDRSNDAIRLTPVLSALRDEVRLSEVDAIDLVHLESTKE